MTDRILSSTQSNHQTRTGVLSPAPPLALFARAAEIIEAWLEDPIDRWRKEKKKYDRVWPRGDKAPPHLSFAAGAVERVKARLEEMGYAVEPSKGNAHWDLLVEGCLRLEVKASEWKLQEHPEPGRRRPRGRYQANIRKKQAGQVDLVVFMAVNGADHHFVIPRPELRGRRNLTIRCYDPAHYTGNLAGFYEAWERVGPALAAARERREFEQGRLEL